MSTATVARLHQERTNWLTTWATAEQDAVKARLTYGLDAPQTQSAETRIDKAHRHVAIINRMLAGE